MFLFTAFYNKTLSLNFWTLEILILRKNHFFNLLFIEIKQNQIGDWSFDILCTVFLLNYF